MTTDTEKQTHTPGPWKVYEYAGGSINVGSYEGERVADNLEVGRRSRDGEALANARLIAAAPDLLAALEAILQEATWGRAAVACGSCGTCDCEWSDTLGFAEAAINKARNGQ